MAKFHIIWGFVVCFVAWVFFLIFPHLDITVAGYFYDPATQSFIGSTSDGILGFLHSFARLFPIYFSIVVILFF